MSLYLDHNASTPIRPQARAALLEALEPAIGNPNAIHAHGRRGHRMIEDARFVISKAVGLPVLHTVFTGGGSEAIALGLFSMASLAPNPVFLVSAIEHEAVRRAAEETGKPCQTVNVDYAGVVSLAALDEALDQAQRAGQTPMVCVMSANNITGVLQPLEAIGEKVRGAGGYFFVDATQSVGKSPLGFGALGADMVSLSAHKFGGPQGIGALCAANRARPKARVFGGGQERGFRAGTQATALIHSMGKAMEAALGAAPLECTQAASLRDAFERGLRAMRNDIDIMGEDAPRLGHVSSFIVPDRAGQQIAIALDLAGISVSAGTACSSGKLKPDSVALAMGRSDEAARGVVRVSFGWNNGPDDAATVLKALGKHLTSSRVSTH
jgi:cysteine desulfurase